MARDYARSSNIIYNPVEAEKKRHSSGRDYRSSVSGSGTRDYRTATVKQPEAPKETPALPTLPTLGESVNRMNAMALPSTYGNVTDSSKLGIVAPQNNAFKQPTKTQKKAAAKIMPTAPTVRTYGNVEKEQEPFNNLRKVPIAGAVYRGLDRLQEFTEPAAKIAQEYYTPGAGLAPIAGFTGAVGNAISKVAPKLGMGAGLGQAVAREAIKEGVSGGVLGAGQSLAAHPEEGFKGAGEGALYGGVLGGALGPVAPILGKAIKSIKGSTRLPETSPIEPTGAQSPTVLTRENPTAILGQNRMDIPEAPVPEEAMKGNWFTNLFGKGGVGIAAGGGNSSRIRPGLLNTSEQIVRRGIKNDKQGLVQDAAALAREQYQNYVDKLSPLKKLGDDTYETAMDASRANNLAHTIIWDKFVTPEGQVVGEGLSKIFKKVARGSDKEFVDYLTLRHAKTRMERGEKVYDDSLNMTPEKVQERLNNYDSRSPKFKELAKEWDAYNDNLLKVYGVNEGFISPKIYETLREKNPNYSPMQRQFLRSEKPGRKFLQKTTSSSFAGQKAPIKEVSKTGSARRIIDPRKTTIEATGAWVNAAMRNRTLQGVAVDLAKNPDKYAGIAKIVQKPKDQRDLRDILINDGENEFIDTLNNEFANAFKKTSLDKDNIVRVMVNGEPIHIQIENPEVIKAIMGMGPQASNLVMDTLGMFSNLTKRGATGLLAPFFATKSLAMDAAQAAIQAKNPAAQATYTVYALLSGIGDKLGIPGLRNMAQEFRRSGGGYSSALKTDSALNKSISGMTRYPIFSPQSVAKGVVNTVASPFRILEGIANVSENASRIAAAKLARKGSTPEAVRKSMSAGREVTVNYSRIGAYGRDLEKLVPYNNAAVQGLRRIGVAFKKNPVRTTAAVAALAVVPKLYEYSQFADDPDYQRLPARERYRNLIVSKRADGTFVKVPMTPEYNAIGELTIEALRKFKDGDENAFKGFQDSLANAFTPPLVGGALQGITQDKGIGGGALGALNSTVAAPAFALASNQSFTGSPIVPQTMTDRSRPYQYDERTTAIAKWLGQKLNQSPKKIDYFMQAYGGDAARLLAPMSSDMGRGTKDATIFKNFIVDPVMTNTLTNDFYKYKNKLSQAVADNKDIDVPFPDWYNENAAKLVTSQSKGSVSKRLAAFNQQKRDINANPGLRPEMKSQALREVQRRINELLIDTNLKLKEYGIPTN